MTNAGISWVEMIGTALVIWCVFWVPLIVIARNIVRQPVRPWNDFAERTPAPEAEPGRELSIEDLERLHGGKL